jgi:valacyclovir hydrolase
MPYVSARGVNFYYEDVGRGAPVVLLAVTLGTARSDISEQIDTFAQTLRVIAPDRRGYGNSRPPQRAYPDDFYQRDADDMLR